MKELMIFLAKEMPAESLLEKLEESLTAVKLTDSKESQRQLAFYCQMYCLRIGTEDQNSMEVIKKFNNVQQISEAFEQKQ